LLAEEGREILFTTAWAESQLTTQTYSWKGNHIPRIDSPAFS